MANRPTGYGLTAELKEKIAAKYDVEKEQEARLWLEAVLEEPLSSEHDKNEPLGMQKMSEVLQSGVVLCRVAAKVTGSKVAFSTGNVPFKSMENINNFLQACVNYGVNKGDLFQTVDLYEMENMFSVICGIHAFGRKARSNGFKGPTLGPNEAKRNPRNFSAEQIEAGKSVIGLQMGGFSYAKPGDHTGIVFDKRRPIMDWETGRSSTNGAENGEENDQAIDSNAVEDNPDNSVKEKEEDTKVEKKNEQEEQNEDELDPPPPPAEEEEETAEEKEETEEVKEENDAGENDEEEETEKEEEEEGGGGDKNEDEEEIPPPDTGDNDKAEESDNATESKADDESTPGDAAVINISDDVNDEPNNEEDEDDAGANENNEQEEDLQTEEVEENEEEDANDDDKETEQDNDDKEDDKEDEAEEQPDNEEEATDEVDEKRDDSESGPQQHTPD